MRAKAGVCYCTAGVNYEMAGVCCSAMANEFMLGISVILGRGFWNTLALVGLQSIQWVRIEGCDCPKIFSLNAKQPGK